MSDAFYRGWQFQQHITGQRGIRDTEHPCEFFFPCAYDAGRGRCQGDGHYMCRECEQHDTIYFLEYWGPDPHADSGRVG